MARSLIATNELIVGENHPSLPDTKNRYGKELWAAWLVEHEDTGDHASPYNIFPIPMHGSVTGTGSAQTVTWPVDTLTEVCSLFIWSANDAGFYAVTGDGVPNVKSNANELPQTDRVTAMDTDGFTLGTAAEVNTAGVAYYWFAVGLGTTADPGTNATPPSWIQHGTALIGGNSSASGNSVEAELDTVFQVEHSESGVHDDGLFDGFSLAEQGEFIADGTATQLVALTNTNMDIDTLYLFPPTSNRIAYQSESMTVLRELGTAALSSTGYVTLDTGKFYVNGTVDGPDETFFQIADGTNGSATFTDSSAYAWPVARTGTCTHSTDYTQAGATSIKFPVYPDNSYLTADFRAAQIHLRRLLDSFSFSFYYREPTRIGSISGPVPTLLLNFVTDTDWYESGGLILPVSPTRHTFELQRIYSGTATTLKVNEWITLYGGSTTTQTQITGTTSVNTGNFVKVTLSGNNRQVSLAIDSTSEGTFTPSLYTYGDDANGVIFSTLTLSGQVPSTLSAATYIDTVVFTQKLRAIQGGYTYPFFAIGSQV